MFFAEVPELVRTRRVFISGGYAYVPDPDLVSLVVSHFRTSLSCSLARLGLTLSCRLASEENRVLPLLASLSSRYLGEDYSTRTPAMGVIKADQIDALAKQPGVFPPCMAQLHEALKTHHHLRHAGRMQYGLFLKVKLQRMWMVYSFLGFLRFFWRKAPCLTFRIIGIIVLFSTAARHLL